MLNFSKKRFSTWQVVIMLTLVFMGIIGIGYAVTVPYSFTAGDPIVAQEVNDNFTTLNSALPIMAADTDNTSSGTALTGAGKTVINSISINIPANGFLIISGTCYINNYGTQLWYTLTPLIDGAAPTGAWNASVEAAATGGAGALFTLAYTVTVPVVSGTRTITQEVGPAAGTTDYFYNRNNLTVLYIPSAQGNVTTAINSPSIRDAYTSSSGK